MKAISLMFLLSAIAAVMGQSGSDTHYVVEVYFLVEPQVMRNYINFGYDERTADATLREDIRFFLDQVNKYFKTMERFGLSIEVRMKRLDIQTTEIFDEAQLRDGTGIEGYVALGVLKDWLRHENSLVNIGYDVALLWTGYNLLSRSGASSITGYALTKSACTRRGGVAVVEFDGTQSTAHTTAHELAHTLGARHDSHHDCPPFVGYVMTPLLKTSNRRRWEFSLCSVRNVTAYIARMDRYRRNCLLVTNTAAMPFDIGSQSGRDIMDVKKLCARKKKTKDSYFCGFDGFYDGHPPQGDSVCRVLYCAHSGSKSCTSATTTEGLLCDVGKRCDSGRCVAAPVSFPTPPNIVSDCLFGDLLSGSVQGYSGTCEEYLTNKGLHQCYRFVVREECCATCAARKIPIEGCEYGDSFQECAQYTPQQICPNNREECCFTCREFRTKRSEIDESIILPKLIREDDDDEVVEEEPFRIVDED